MEILPIVFLILMISLSVIGKSSRPNKNGQKAQQASPSQAAAARSKQTAYPAWRCTNCGTAENTGRFCITCGARRPLEKQQSISRPAALPKSTISSRVAPTPLHVVEATSLGGHTHTESSITGIEEECHTGPVVKKQAAVKAPAAGQAAFQFDANQMRNAVLYSEILGKPRSLRNR